MPTPPVPSHQELLRIARAAIVGHLAALKAGRGLGRFRIPRLTGLMQALPKSKWPYFHMTPEMFVQLSGATNFTSASERWRLRPGQVCVMPRGVPHSERVQRWRGPFHNLVFMYVGSTLFFHLSYEEKPGVPAVLAAHYLENVPVVLRLAEYLQDAAEVFHSRNPHREDVFSALMQTHFSVLLSLLEGVWAPHKEEPFKVASVRQLIMGHLHDRELSVGKLAESIHCKPSYLSSLFHQETGMGLKAFINEQRLVKAKRLLEDSSLSIREIAGAAGYQDAGYFTRRFRHTTGMTPRAFRRSAGRGPGPLSRK
jgi:AraC-like DNA-binding protein